MLLRTRVLRFPGVLAVLLLLLPAMVVGADTADGTSTKPAAGEVARVVITDDLDGLVQRRQIRALVAWSSTDYYLDKGRPRGMFYEITSEFERWYNKREKRVLQPVHVVIIPVARDELISMLEAGRGDIAFAALTVTPERKRRIAFSDPIHTGVSEVVISHRASILMPDRDALAGEVLFLRASSSYAASVKALNLDLMARGKPPVTIRHADENLEDEDILELISAGIVQRTVVDDYKAGLWMKAMPDLRVEQATVSENGTLALGLRKNAPKLKALVDQFVRSHRVGTEYGNVLARRYFGNNSRIRQPLAAADLQRYQNTIGLFRKYGEQYNFDPLLLAAQGFQESGLDQSARSSAGAVGVMQLLPATGKSMKVGDIYRIEPNIHAGVKYLRHIADTWLKDPKIDNYNRTLLSFAAYNAGPGNLRRARELAKRKNMNPDIWFQNVEYAMGEVIGVEPVRYVANISKYYLAYKSVELQQQQREEAKRQVGEGP